MKLDMHCHTFEGSPDGHVPIEEYINSLKEQGFDGMLVTDHDSYGGYDFYDKKLRDKITDFTVLKGIEYDTLDGGHFIVVLPTGVHLPLLEHRGLSVRLLTHVVHSYGGILGPAHPCGEPFLSIFSTGKFKKREQTIAKRFDFIEGFNCGEDKEANDRAVAIAKKYDKPVTGGSDAHKHDCVGMAYTILDEEVRDENELIAYIKSNKPTEWGGEKYLGTIKEHLGRWNKLLVYGFWPYNKAGALKHIKKRHIELNDIRVELRKRRLEAEEGLEQLREKNRDTWEHLQDLLEHDLIEEMKKYVQHGNVNTYEHAKSVVIASDKLARKLHLKNIDRHAMLRGAFMHDFYLYDWHEKDNGEHKLHGFHHANKAIDNAAEILDAELKEQEIIASHMWPLTITTIPKSREAWVVCMADKYVSTKETILMREKKKRIRKMMRKIKRRVRRNRLDSSDKKKESA